jgi:dTDP-4-dehydrorhamnose reductase
MRLLVTGREGQVARALIERGANAGHDVIPLGRPELDLAGEKSALVSAILAVRPDAIVSAAAYTAVDKAESEPDLAFAVNANGPAALASAAAALDVPLLHLSTDYVFDGLKDAPYVEGDLTAPTGVYGASKLAGEDAVRAGCPNHVILRTAWVYSPFGSNFVKAMLRLGGSRDELSVVSDQVGNPTNALDIAAGVLAVATNLVGNSDPARRGTFHMVGGGSASWAAFAEGNFAASRAAGGPTARVKPITTADYPTPAKRPANSRLDCAKLYQIHNVRLPHWSQSLREVVTQLVRQHPSTQGPIRQ